MPIKDRDTINNLHGIAQFSLFVTSYIPLFVLIIAKQISKNIDFLHWAGLTYEGVSTIVSKFGLSIVLLCISCFGLLGFLLTLKNIQDAAKNGFPATVIDVKNKNSEAIGYIATYIIPFLFQSFDGWYECLAVLFLLLIIYRIYINSSLLLVNPLLSFRFSIYEVEFEVNGKARNGLIISKNKYLQDGADIKLYEIGHKLYFATDNN